MFHTALARPCPEGPARSSMIVTVSFCTDPKPSPNSAAPPRISVAVARPGCPEPGSVHMAAVTRPMPSAPDTIAGVSRTVRPYWSYRAPAVQRPTTTHDAYTARAALTSQAARSKGIARKVTILLAEIATNSIISRGEANTAHSFRPRGPSAWRSEEHTSELQSRGHLVCRLLLEKK